MKFPIKIIIIVGTVLFLGIIGYFIWTAFYPNNETPTIPENPPELPIGSEAPVIPQTNEQLGLIKVSDKTVFSFWKTGSGELYYLTLDGKVMNAKGGADPEVASQSIQALNRVEVQNGGNRLLVSFGNPATPQWGIFDVADKTWRPVPSDVLNATWGEKDNQLIVLIKTGQDQNLSLIDLGVNPQKPKVYVKDLRLENVRLFFQPPQDLFIVENASAIYSGRIWKLDLKTLSMNLLRAPTRGLLLDWSQDRSAAFLFSALPRTFSILNGFLSSQYQMFFNTLPSKCTATASTSYCFVPTNVSANIVLPDQYAMGDFYSTDALYSIDRQTGSIDKYLGIADGTSPLIDAKYPLELLGKMYFINHYDNFIYELDISKAK